MNDADIVLMRKIAREEFWELLDCDLVPLLMDFVGVQVEASHIKEEPKISIPEETFRVLDWEPSKGTKLGDFETAFKSMNKVDPWQKCFGFLKDNGATIGSSFHQDAYVYRYWIYSERYQDRIFRKKLGAPEATS